MKLLIEISEGGLPPRGYGMAWYLPDENRAVYAIFPCNHIFGFFRTLWYQVRNRRLPEDQKLLMRIEHKIDEIIKKIEE